MVLIRPSWPSSGPAVTTTWSPSFKASLMGTTRSPPPMRKAANKLGLFFCQRHKLTVLGKHPGKVVHAQQILLHGAGICRIADKITGKERLGRIDPFAAYFDLGLILGIKELLHGASRHHTLDALAHYVFATVNDLDHIPHEHHPLAVLRVAHGVWVWLRQGACARRRSIFKP